MLSSPRANVQIMVKSFVMVQTGTYQEQHLRPFNANITSQNINRIEEATNGGRNLGVGAVQELATDIIAPSANTEGASLINQGWNSRRFRFIMIVEETHPFIKGFTTQRILFGYTDHCDASYNHLDPNMRIYFNSETVITNSIDNTGPAGPVMRSVITASNQIISPVQMVSDQNGNQYTRATHLIRPEDVFTLGQTMDVKNKLELSGRLDGPITAVLDHRTLAGAGNSYQYNRRKDCSPVRYLSGTLSGFQNALLEANSDDMFEDNDRYHLLGNASGFVKNNTMGSNVFIAMLRDHLGYTQKGYVTLKELQGLFPETVSDQVTMYSMDNGQSIRKVSHVQDSQVWTGADHISIAASLIAQTVPAVMMDNFFRSVSVSVTNGNGPNSYLFDINPGMTRTLVNISSDVAMNCVNELERRLIVDVLNLITQGNQIPFKLIVSSDLAGETIIDLSLGSEPMTRYIAPTFTDSLFTPVMTKDANLASSISNDLLFLVDNIVHSPTSNKSGVMTGYQQPQPTVQAIPQQGENYADLGLL